jgi:FkbM family methyltransferase
MKLEEIKKILENQEIKMVDSYELDGKQYGRSLFDVEWLKIITKTPNIIFDIGCYDGGDSIRFIKSYPGVNVFSFEASPLRWGGLIDTAKKYNFNVICKAVGQIDGMCKFYDSLIDDERVDAQGSMFQHTDFYKQKYPRIKQKKEFSEIPCIRVDTFCEENNINKIDLVHIDVEGAEINVIRGFNKILPKMVFVETLGDEMFFGGTKSDELNELLLSMGYFLIKDLNSDRLYIHKNYVDD